jgi:uncharacterized membrane protein YdbT with pleckstrin-like domain
MSRPEPAAAWVYRGLWGILARWLRVPKEPPDMPPGEEAGEVIRPAPGFLSYRKTGWWIVTAILSVIWVVLVVVLLIAVWPVALIVFLVGLPLILLHVIPGYLGIHLEYDTTWYGLSDRSLRIRRGIWVIREVTITFENVQNVAVSQGPLQRAFGIADVTVETAGAKAAQQGQQQGATAANGLIAGVANAEAIRERIMGRVRASRSAGLGDEERTARRGTPAAGWSPGQVAALRDIRDAARALARKGPGSSV